MLFLALFGISTLWGTFITKEEYAKMIYKNPRGIGCDKCHGENGEGMVISIYIKDGEEKELRAPRINDISIKRFLKAFNQNSLLMPTYFLTQDEKAYIYYYITSKANKK